MSELQLAPKNCNNYKEFSKQGRCPLSCVCNEDCVFVWKKKYEDLDRLDFDDLQSTEDLVDEIEYLRIEINTLESDNDELYWEKDDLENKYKTVITDLANILNDESFEKLRKLNLDGKVSDWFDDLDMERSCIKVKAKDKIIDVQKKD